MTSKTEHYQLEQLSGGEPFSSDGQQYTTTDRATIDRVLYQGAQAHHHNGAAAVNENPTTGLTLTLDTTQGLLAGGQTVTYVWTLVDVNGFETAASPPVFLDTPGQAATPGSPTISADSLAGTLPAGAYSYCVSAYTGSVNTSETPASVPVSVQLNATGEITLFFPTQPAGTVGWNIYRRKPGGVVYFYVTSVTTTSWVDNGSLPDICSRVSPTRNTTSSTNTITVTLPGVTPTLPAGYTWNLYRTFITGNYTNSLLAHIVNGSTSYVDNGAATTVGAPPASSQLIGSPPQINLATDVVGALPSSMVGGYPLSVTFSFPGPLSKPVDNPAVWVCDWPAGLILGARASLGRGSSPASLAVIADVLKGSGTTPTYASVYVGATPNPKPEVPVGLQVGAVAPPNVTSLALGDSLTVDLLQVGGGATPTDHDLTITIDLFVSVPGGTLGAP